MMLLKEIKIIYNLLSCYKIDSIILNIWKIISKSLLVISQLILEISIISSISIKAFIRWWKIIDSYFLFYLKFLKLSIFQSIIQQILSWFYILFNFLIFKFVNIKNLLIKIKFIWIYHLFYLIKTLLIMILMLVLGLLLMSFHSSMIILECSKLILYWIEDQIECFLTWIFIVNSFLVFIYQLCYTNCLLI